MIDQPIEARIAATLTDLAASKISADVAETRLDVLTRALEDAAPVFLVIDLDEWGRVTRQRLIARPDLKAAA